VFASEMFVVRKMFVCLISMTSLGATINCGNSGSEKNTNHIWGRQSNGLRKSIRPWDFILDLDGSVESLPGPEMEGEIPSASIDSLPQQDQMTRQERFAFASLLYEVTSGRKPFEELSSDEVQHYYSNAEFPDDVRTLPRFIVILSFWSVEFADIGT
jgi:hypothetical protein